jgi:hypothetical protein
MPTTPKRTLAYWLCQVGGWSVWFLINGLLVALIAEDPERQAWGIGFWGLNAALGFGVTHGFRTLVKRWRWTEMPLRRFAPRVVAACLVMAVAVALATKGISAALEPWKPALEQPEGFELDPTVAFVGFTLNTAFVFFVWSLLYFGLHYFWNFRQAEVDRWRLEAEAQAATLKALELQLNPHFFFNSLNSVRALIVEDPTRAQRAVTRLAALMRYTLQAGEATTVPLAREMKMVRSYLELEAIRYEERLRFCLDAEERAERRPVPLLLVQTLVENALKHGIAHRTEGGRVDVTARVTEDGSLRLVVENTGTLDDAPATDANGEATTGVGLRNARTRLRLLFGDAATLRLDATPHDTVRAVVCIPADVRPPAADADAVASGRRARPADASALPVSS